MARRRRFTATGMSLRNDGSARSAIDGSRNRLACSRVRYPRAHNTRVAGAVSPSARASAITLAESDLGIVHFNYLSSIRSEDSHPLHLDRNIQSAPPDR